MDRSLLLRNRAVARIVVGIPEGHSHLRARIESASGDVITLQEATLAALTRAYIDIKTHPERTAVELLAEIVGQRKPGFAEHQLLEVESDPVALARELAGRPQQPSDSSPSPAVAEADDDRATQDLPELDVTSGRLKLHAAAPGEGVFGETPTLATPRASLVAPGDSDS
jgi:hypothetical protein